MLNWVGEEILSKAMLMLKLQEKQLLGNSISRETASAKALKAREGLQASARS